MIEHERGESMNAANERRESMPAFDSSTISPHIVDLSGFSKNAAKKPRPSLSFGQKASAWIHLFKRQDRSHRSMVPFSPQKKTARPSIRGFLKLPFAMLALALKRSARTPRPAHTALSPLSRDTAPAPKVPPPITIKLSKKRKAGFSLFPNTAWKRQVAAFALLAVLVTLPLQALLSYAGLIRQAGVVAADAREAASDLKTAGEHALLGEGSASGSFARSASIFASTRGRIDDVTVRLAALLSGNGEALSNGAKVLSAGEEIAKAGAELAEGLDAVQKSQGTNAEKLARMSKALETALPHLENGVEQINGISVRGVPSRYQKAFVRIREDVQSALADLKETSLAAPTLLDAVGINGKRRYLVIFQNATELRPTGGFIGSFALMDLEDGEISGIEIPGGGSYDLRGGFTKRVMAPDQLRLVNPRWEFQDANWFPDFPTSARSLTWFYEKSGGPTVDGVIAITSNVMQELLRAVGPIEMPEYGRTITAENFLLETQKAVEIEYDRETNRPKQIIADLAPKILKKLVDRGSSDLPKLAEALGNALAAKDIQVHFRDENLQQAAEAFGWTGALRPLPNADYLAVIDTNIAGGKTDGVIEASVRHETSFEEHGGIIDTVTITRAHRGKPGELFTGIKNIDYVRVYVPKGSILLSAEGFEAPAEGYFLPQDSTLQPSALLAAVEGATTIGSAGTTIHDESGLTVFGNWIQLEPGETKTATLRYRLPFRLDELTHSPETWAEKLKNRIGTYVPSASLKLVVQRQAGAGRRVFESTILAPDGWSIRNSIPEGARIEPGKVELKTTLDRDVYIGTLLVNREY